MAGIRILTNLDGRTALSAVGHVARRLTFSVLHMSEWELAVQRGSFVGSIFVGAFIAYCDFKVLIYGDQGDRVEIEINRNTPWWTGLIGVNRVKNWATSLADGIEDEIERLGSQVLGRREF